MSRGHEGAAQEPEPVIEANTQALGDFLGVFFPGRDIDIAGMKRVEAEVDQLLCGHCQGRGVSERSRSALASGQGQGRAAVWARRARRSRS